MMKDYIAVDLETTGFSVKLEKIIEIGAIKVIDGEIVDTFETLINPGKVISDRIIDVTGITNEMVVGAPTISEKIHEFMVFVGELPLLGHNLSFDFSFLKKAAINHGYNFERYGIDTLKLARKYFPDLESKKLDDLCSYFGISDENHHRALNDAVAAHELYKILAKNGADEEKPAQLVFSVKKETPITSKQVKFLTDLVIRHNVDIDYDIASLSKNEASRKIDLILSTYGRS